MNYYNEFDPKTAAWLRELIKAKLIPDGFVDERSITDVSPNDLDGYTQCHFFAGIGGWPLALRIAGWPDDREVWTGSCPCQPFSQAGKQKGTQDARHLWPWFRHLIFRRRPSIAFGEQVASELGRDWLAGIRGNLETLGYGFGSADLCAPSVQAAHPRQRLFWVAYTDSSRSQQRRETAETNRHRNSAFTDGGFSGLGNTINAGSQGHRKPSEQPISEGWQGAQRHSSASGFWDQYDIAKFRDGKSRRIEPGSFPLANGIPARVVRLRGYGNAIVPELAAKFIQASLEAINEVESLTQSQTK